MKHQEKKFLVTDFDDIKKRLQAVGAAKGEETHSTHYYAQVDGKDVVKLVDQGGKCEIHLLEESDSKFTLTKRLSVPNISAGLQWLRDKGYMAYTAVTMTHTDYAYNGGLVGLYDINNSLQSVILDFPAEQHADMEKQFGLENAEQITTPYNKLLEDMGKIKPKTL